MFFGLRADRRDQPSALAQFAIAALFRLFP